MKLILYRILEKEFHIEYVCRQCKGISCILDINTAVIMVSQSQLTADGIRQVISVVSESILQYTRLFLLLLVDNTSCAQLSSLIQCLLAGVMLFPIPVTILYAYFLSLD